MKHRLLFFILVSAVSVVWGAKDNDRRPPSVLAMGDSSRPGVAQKLVRRTCGAAKSCKDCCVCCGKCVCNTYECSSSCYKNCVVPCMCDFCQSLKRSLGDAAEWGANHPEEAHDLVVIAAGLVFLHTSICFGYIIPGHTPDSSDSTN